MSFYRTQLENWLKTIDIKADKVLDFGGAANPVKGRTKSWEVNKYIILDNTSETPKSKDYRYSNLNIGGFHLEAENANIAFCLEVFEYIYDPVTALMTIREHLRDGGVAYISFPFVYPIHEPKQIDYLRYTENGVKRLLELSGFSKHEIFYRKDRSGKLSEFYRADGMHPAKGINHSIYGYFVKAVK